MLRRFLKDTSLMISGQILLVNCFLLPPFFLKMKFHSRCNVCFGFYFKQKHSCYHVYKAICHISYYYTKNIFQAFAVCYTVLAINKNGYSYLRNRYFTQIERVDIQDINLACKLLPSMLIDSNKDVPQSSGTLIFTTIRV